MWLKEVLSQLDLSEDTSNNRVNKVNELTRYMEHLRLKHDPSSCRHPGQYASALRGVVGNSKSVAERKGVKSNRPTVAGSIDCL